MTLRPYRAVIFGLNGTLLDTGAIYRRAFMEAAAGLGYAVPAALYDGLAGIATRECGPMLLPAFGADFPIQRFYQAYYARRAALLQPGVPVRAGIPALLRRLDCPLAVATSAGRATALAHLRRAGLAGHFGRVVTRDDVVRGKPAPDLFLRAAALLDVTPGGCVAVEESAAGLQAAAAAGMQVVLLGDAPPALPRCWIATARHVADLGRILLTAALEPGTTFIR